jgi:hypothetical protein
LAASVLLYFVPAAFGPYRLRELVEIKTKLDYPVVSKIWLENIAVENIAIAVPVITERRIVEIAQVFFRNSRIEFKSDYFFAVWRKQSKWPIAPVSS